MKVELDNITLEKMWLDFDWSNAEYELLDLQKQLTKATYARNKEATRQIQNRIVTSLSAKALAVRHVSKNFTRPGIDGETWRTPADKMRAALSLTNIGYKAQPSLRVTIQEKFSGKERHLCVHTCYDKAMQVLYSYSIAPIAEARADFKSFAFRRGRSALDAHIYLMRALSFKGAPEYVLYADIKACYNSISHRWLLEHIPMDKHVLAQFLNAGFVFAGEIFPSEEKGIDLGANISTYLGNMTLDMLRGFIYSNFKGSTNNDYANGDMIRFADDIVITARTRDDAEQIRNLIVEFLTPRGLALSAEKTKIVHISEGFNFLSRHYVKCNGVIRATPSEKAIAKFEQSLSDAILSHTGSQKALIDTVNKKLIGWANYHRICDATDAFKYIDVVVNALLIRASQTKHPKLSQNQIISKYWYKDIFNNYTYSLPTKREFQIVRLADTILIEHRAVKLDPNPYLDKDYFDSREESRSINNVTGEQKAIWNRQGGKCYYCGKPILPDHDRQLVKVNAESRKSIAGFALIHSMCANDEYFYCQTEKNIENASALELISILEQAINNDVKSNKKMQPAYEKLANYFLAQNSPSLTMTFKQIESIIDKPLAQSAYKNSKYWFKNDSSALSQAWLTQGYAIKSISIEDQKVVFSQTETAKAQLIIPKILLSQKIPKSAKFELESFFKHIKEKYGL